MQVAGRSAPRPRACALLLGVFLATGTAIVPGAQCPYINCTLERRQFCHPGSSQCGPCLVPLEENKKGRCVDKPDVSFSELDEEIDFLSSVIAKQQESKVKPAENPSRAAAQPPTNQTTTPRPSSPTPLPPKTGSTVERRGPDVLPFPSRDTLLLILISACIIVGTIALILAAVCWIKLQRESRLAEKVDYQAFGSGKTVKPVSSNGTMSSDKTLAHSAQMYHYHHQKQQMISLEKHKEESKIPESGDTSDEENEGDFTVYECPGLAPTGEMEVRNPLFDDSTLHHQTSHK